MLDVLNAIASNWLFTVLTVIAGGLVCVAIVFRILNKRSAPASTPMIGVRRHTRVGSPGITMSELIELREKLSKLEASLNELREVKVRRPKVICPTHGEVEPIKLLNGTLLCPHLHRLYPLEDENADGGSKLEELSKKLEALEAQVQKLQRQLNRHMMMSEGSKQTIEGSA